MQQSSIRRNFISVLSLTHSFKSELTSKLSINSIKILEMFNWKQNASFISLLSLTKSRNGCLNVQMMKHFICVDKRPRSAILWRANIRTLKKWFGIPIFQTIICTRTNCVSKNDFFCWYVPTFFIECHMSLANVSDTRPCTQHKVILMKNYLTKEQQQKQPRIDLAKNNISEQRMENQWKWTKKMHTTYAVIEGYWRNPNKIGESECKSVKNEKQRKTKCWNVQQLRPKRSNPFTEWHIQLKFVFKQ